PPPPTRASRGTRPLSMRETSARSSALRATMRAGRGGKYVDERVTRFSVRLTRWRLALVTAGSGGGPGAGAREQKAREHDEGRSRHRERDVDVGEAPRKAHGDAAKGAKAGGRHVEEAEHPSANGFGGVYLNERLGHAAERELEEAGQKQKR